MATPLTKAVSRRTEARYIGRNVILTIAPAGSQQEAFIGVRLEGTRKQYVGRLSDVFRLFAMWHGQKEAAAKRAARKAGVPWRTAKRAFIAENSIPKNKRKTKDTL